MYDLVNGYCVGDRRPSRLGQAYSRVFLGAALSSGASDESTLRILRQLCSVAVVE